MQKEAENKLQNETDKHQDLREVLRVDKKTHDRTNKTSIEGENDK